MKRKEVTQIYHYSKEIEKLEREIDKLQERKAQIENSTLRSPKLDGMPRSGRGDGSPVEKAGILAGEIKTLIDEQIAIVERYKFKIEMKRKEIYEYITSLDDPQLEQIIMYRCINLCTWDQVAAYVGGQNTEDSVRMRFNRHFPE